MPARLLIMIQPHVTELVLHMHYAAAKRTSHHPRRSLQGDGVAAWLGCPVAVVVPGLAW